MTEEQFRAWRRADQAKSARLAGLSPTDRDLIRIAARPDHARWVEQIRAVGGCANPIYLAGGTITRDTATGELVHAYSTASEPGGRLAVRCRNRRATRCAPCAYQHQGDTFHLVRTGLVGGKTVPTNVRDRPRLFVTFTAPSFGPVHRATSGGDRCHPRRDRGTCEHERPLGCPARHSVDDTLIGQPLCPGCYDYTGHALWNAHVGPLWDGFTHTLRRRLATAAGIPRARLRDYLTVSFAKVAEYQRRGAVHLHAVIRLDGPDGPGSKPPAWATAELLASLVPNAAARVRVHAPETRQLGAYELRWGTQLDVRPLRAAIEDEHGLTDDAVAAYLAKYVTKSTETAGAADTRIRNRRDIELLPVTPHARALLRTCWDLGGIPELTHLRLRHWAHMLGYRGHCLTKSRTYSTTYRALRTARREWHTTTDPHHPGGDASVTVQAAWWYAGHGYTPGQALIAQGIAEDLARSRAAVREDRTARRGWGA